MSKNKVTYEKKVEIVRDYLDGRVGYKESIQRANNSAASFRHWVHLYKGNGAAGLLPNSWNKVYLEDTKWKAVQEYLSGHGSLESVCEKYEIRSTSQLRSWIKVYHAHGDFNSVKFSGGGSYMKQGRSTTQEERQGLAGQWKRLRRDGLEVQGELPAGTHLDAAVRGDGRKRSGGSARKAEEGPSTQNRAGESADRDRTAQAQAVSGGNGA